MVDYQKELEEMVCSKNLMNSYKLYFLKTLVINVSKEKRSFHSMSWLPGCVHILLRMYV